MDPNGTSKITISQEEEHGGGQRWQPEAQEQSKNLHLIPFDFKATLTLPLNGKLSVHTWQFVQEDTYILAKARHAADALDIP